MTDNKVPDPKVEFSDTESLDAKRSSRKTKIAVIGVLVLVLLFGAIVSATFFVILRKPSTNRLAEVNLEVDETLTYRVDHKIEMQKGNVQQNSIHAIVSFRVLNKTSDEYWFLMKINVTATDGNVKTQGFDQNTKSLTDYFLVRLLLGQSKEDKNPEPFELYGNRQTEAEFIHYVCGILDLLLPALKRDLYEDVDGEKLASGSEPSPENSPLLPGDIKVHRKANTSDKDAVFIQKYYNSKDLINVSSEFDIGFEYSDFALINKSNGMVTESRAYFSEQLNFGEPIHTNDGDHVTMLKIDLFSQVSLIDQTNSFYFGKAESEGITFHLFVRLVVPGSGADFTNDNEFGWHPTNSSQMSPNNGSFSGELHNLTNSSSLSVKRRKRRAARPIGFQASSLTTSLNNHFPSSQASEFLSLEEKFQLFKKEVIGVNVTGEGRVSVDTISQKVEVGFYIKIGPNDWEKIVYESFQGTDLTNGEVITREFKWDKTITYATWVYFVRLGVDFILDVSVSVKLSFPPLQNSVGTSVSPPRIGIKIDPVAEVTAEIDGFAYVPLIQRADAKGSGTLIQLSLPVMLTYNGNNWCLDVSCDLIALKLSAGIYYRWWNWSPRSWGWGKIRTFKDFGTLSAIEKKWQEISKCSSHTGPQVAHPDVIGWGEWLLGCFGLCYYGK